MKVIVELHTIAERLGLAETLESMAGSWSADLVLVPFILLNSTLAPRFLSFKQAEAWMFLTISLSRIMEDDPGLLMKWFDLSELMEREYKRD
jgi:hypothetical protein